MQDVTIQIIIAASLAFIVGYALALIILDTKHSKELQELIQRNEELEKLLSK